MRINYPNLDDFQHLHISEIERMEEEAIGREMREEELLMREPRPDAVHRKKFRCPGCDKPLGHGPAEGINGKAYHPQCAEEFKSKEEK